jgi:hypothetical protein
VNFLSIDFAVISVTVVCAIKQSDIDSRATNRVLDFIGEIPVLLCVLCLIEVCRSLFFRKGAELCTACSSRLATFCMSCYRARRLASLLSMFRSELVCRSVAFLPLYLFN